MMKIYFRLFLVYVLLVIQVISITYVCDRSASCGCSNDDAIVNKIVGGESAISSSWGWMVSLRDFTNRHICGGVIVSSLYVVTAAHCISSPSVSSSDMSIAVGMTRLNEVETVGQVRKIVQIIRHANYNAVTNTNDIAVLRLNASLDLSPSKSTARLCLPRLQPTNNVEIYPPDASSLIAIGWGTLVFGIKNNPNQLQQVTVNAVPSNDVACSSSIHNSKLQFCAGVNGGGKDTCQGDSGGPLMRFESVQRRWVLTGLTSYGIGCGDPFYAGVYTRVPAYTDWLQNIIGSDDLVEVEINAPDVNYPNIVPVPSTNSSTSLNTAAIWTTTRSTDSNVLMNIAQHSCSFTFFSCFLIICFPMMFE